MMTLVKIEGTEDNKLVTIALTLSREEISNLKAALLDICMMSIATPDATDEQRQSAYFLGALFRPLHDYRPEKMHLDPH